MMNFHDYFDWLIEVIEARRKVRLTLESFVLWRYLTRLSDKLNNELDRFL